MAVVQIEFEIPRDILEGIVAGATDENVGVLRRAVEVMGGGVAVNAMGQKIREKAAGLMKQGGIIPKAGAAKAVGAKALGIVKLHPKAAIAAGVGAVAVGAGAAAVEWWKKHDQKELQEFLLALERYVDAVCMAQMSPRRIDALEKVIDVLKKHKHYKKITSMLSADRFEGLVDIILAYTIELAEKNGIELQKEELRESSDLMDDLSIYLNAQKRIFEEAA